MAGTILPELFGRTSAFHIKQVGRRFCVQHPVAEQVISKVAAFLSQPGSGMTSRLHNTLALTFTPGQAPPLYKIMLS
jgi:hypothetical protein